MTVLSIRIGNDHLSAEISPRGAELRSLKLEPSGDQLLWQADPAFWGQSSPLLFPICGRAIDNRVAVEGQDYPMTIHGFAMESAFRVTGSAADFCRLELLSDDATRARYPFDFRLEQEYRLEGPRLIFRTLVENTGSAPMPFSFGYHPGLVLPLPGLEGEDHAVLLANQAEPAPAEQQENFLTGGRLPSPFQGGRLAVTDAVFHPSSSIILETGAGDALFYGSGSRGLHIRWEGLENLVLWRPQAAGFLCVEPWQGLPSLIGAGPELSARPFSVTLPPGASRAFSLTIETSAL